MSDVVELKEKIRRLKSQLANQKRINKRLIEDNKTLYASFKESIKHIDDAISGKSVEEVIQDLKNEGEL